MLQHFKRLPIHDLGNAIGDGGYAVMNVHLARGDVDRLVGRLVKSLASASERKHREQ